MLRQGKIRFVFVFFHTFVLVLSISFVMKMRSLAVVVVLFCAVFASCHRLPEGALSGVFSVSPTQQVRFSKGNLQYHFTTENHLCIDSTEQTGVWRFAEQQYDVIGYDNRNHLVAIDLFGWGTSSYHDDTDSNNVHYYPFDTMRTEVSHDFNFFGYGPSTNMPSPDLVGSSRCYDWGVYNAIENGGNVPDLWRTPTASEWDYLFCQRSASTVAGVSNARFCKATVCGMGGIVLFPDSYEHPSSAPMPTAINNDTAAFDVNVFDSRAWRTMQARGAVFLPAAGARDKSQVAGMGHEGRYWSATNDGSYIAYSLHFYDGAIHTQYPDNRLYGFSVRLVQEVREDER